MKEYQLSNSVALVSIRMAYWLDVLCDDRGSFSGAAGGGSVTFDDIFCTTTSTLLDHKCVF